MAPKGCFVATLNAIRYLNAQYNIIRDRSPLRLDGDTINLAAYHIFWILLAISPAVKEAPIDRRLLVKKAAESQLTD